MNEIEKLKEENEQLRILAQQDFLTMLMNRSTFENEVNAILKERQGGSLLMIDLDKFKSINDKYGHIIGDKVLQEFAKIMKIYFFPKDLLARMGGDEFAVFLPGQHQKNMLSQKIDSIKERFAQTGEELEINKKLKFTVGVAVANADDTFHTLYERADIAMLTGKKNPNTTIKYYNPKKDIAFLNIHKKKSPAFFNSDVKQIQKYMREINPKNGAYCPDYQNFMTVYHFLERGLSRHYQTIPLILISLTDASGDFPPLEERLSLTHVLKDSIQSALRFSDIFTQYSSMQFLVMAPCTNDDNVSLIKNRILQSMKKQLPNRKDLTLHFSFYPLQPTSAKKSSIKKL